MRAKCLFTFNFRLLFNVFKRFDALNYNHSGIHFIISYVFFSLIAVAVAIAVVEMTLTLNFYVLNLYNTRMWREKKVLTLLIKAMNLISQFKYNIL